MSIEAMKQALEALEFANVNHWWGSSNIEKAITSLRQAISDAEKQEPVAWVTDLKFDSETELIPARRKGKLGTGGFNIPLYTKANT